MAAGGQNRKTRAQAELTGTARADRHRDPVVIAPGVPVKPPGMSVAAGELWDAYLPLLAKGGVLEQVDGLGLSQVFEAYVLATRSLDIVGDSPVIEGEDGYGRQEFKKHPGVTAWKDAVGVLRAGLADYGLTPLGRTRMADALRRPGDSGPQLPDDAPPKWTPTVVG